MMAQFEMLHKLKTGKANGFPAVNEFLQPVKTAGRRKSSTHQVSNKGSCHLALKLKISYLIWVILK